MQYFFDLFGCVKNQVDAENMMANLNITGWENSPSAETADLIIVNSCGFIKSAKQESINAVLEWRKLYPEKKILLAGCLAERYAKELAKIMPEVDGFFGVKDISEITKTASKIMKRKNAGILPAENLRRQLQGQRPLLSLPGSAYVKISEGCSNNCSYCAIPLIRGSLVSRAVPDILDECRALLDRGIKELCIIGQDIGSFGCDWKDLSSKLQAISRLPELLESISTLKGNFWVRLLYIHPAHFPLQALDVMERDKRFLPYFDIPFQHASAKILAAMNRCDISASGSGNAENYLELLETIRSRLPCAVVRSTFLIGFPGETEEDFQALLDFQKKAALDWLGCFVWSREENTTAYSMRGRVPAKTALTRKQIIEERQIPITEKNMDRFAGLTLDVLVEEEIDCGEDGESLTLGRLYCQAPEVDGAAVITGKSPKAGTLASCKVIARRGFDLEVQIAG